MFHQLSIFCIILLNLKGLSSANVSPLFDRCLELPEPDIYNKRLNETIQCFRSHLKTGIPEHGLPSFEPLKLNISELNIDNIFLLTKLKVRDFTVSGLMDFDIDAISTSKTFYTPAASPENIVYSFDKVVFDTYYDGTINFLGLVQFTGRGELKITLNDVRLPTTTFFQVEPPLVSTFYADLKVDNITVSITGMHGDEELVAGALQRMLKYLIDTFPDRVSVVLNEMGLTILNKLYKGIGYEEYYNAILTSKCKVNL